MPDFNPGGAEHVMVTLGNHLVVNNYLVEFIVTRHEGPLIERLNDSIRVVSLDCSLSNSIFPLISYLRKSRRDVLISTLKECNLYSIIGRYFTKNEFKLVIREANTPSAEYFYEKTLKDKIKNYFVRRLYKKSDQVIALSHLMKQELVSQIGVSEKKISVVGNPVDIDNIYRLSSEPLSDREKAFFDLYDSKLILSVGRFSKVKNFKFGIDLLNLLKKNGLHYGYVIVGDGIEKANLVEKVEASGLSEQVLFVGYQKNPFKYLSRGNVFLMPSLYEGLPNVLLQAISLKLKVLVSDSPGAGPLLTRDSKAGLVYSYNDLSDAVTKFIEIEEESFDMNFSFEYIKSNFSQEKILGVYLDLIEDLIDEG
ncbi:glycosyltransferase [Nitrincola tapanii]|nr:glycosyltransferase [Nitrincola tapanii]